MIENKSSSCGVCERIAMTITSLKGVGEKTA